MKDPDILKQPLPVGTEKEKWLSLTGRPENYTFEKSFKLLWEKTYKDFNAEFYEQANGPGTYQKVMMVLPLNCDERSRAEKCKINIICNETIFSRRVPVRRNE